jgi:hypothetical protein
MAEARCKWTARAPSAMLCLQLHLQHRAARVKSIDKDNKNHPSDSLTGRNSVRDHKIEKTN